MENELEIKEHQFEYREETNDSTPNAMFELCANKSFKRFKLNDSKDEKKKVEFVYMRQYIN